MVDNWMLDIETLGTGSTPRPLSIALVLFSLDRGVLHSEHYHIQQATAPGEVDADTALWWMAQGEDARQAVLDGQKKAIPFSSFSFGPCSGDVRLWARGIDWFWMENLYRATGRSWPFKASQVRCMRFCDQICPAPPAKIKHSALHDCWAQIEHLQAAVRMVPGLDVVLQ